MTARRHERGEYRPIFVALIDGPDFLRLPERARTLIVHVKLRLGPLGLSVHPGADSLAYSTGMPRKAVTSNMDVLEKEGWVEKEASLLWLVRGLEFEPQMSAANPKHRAYVASVIATLPRLRIVSRFRERYAAYFTDTVSDRVSDTVGESRPPSSTTVSRTTKTPAPRAREDDPIVAELREAMPDVYRNALDGLLRAAHNPSGAAAHIRGMGPGGVNQEFTWDVIGRALVDLAAHSDTSFGPKRFRAFCRSIIAEDSNKPAIGRARPETDGERARRIADELERQEKPAA